MSEGSPHRLLAAPPVRLDVDGFVVRRYLESDAEALAEAISTSDGHLRPWMPWMGHEPLAIEARRELIRSWGLAWDERSDFTMGIFEGDSVIGGTGIHLRGEPGSVEIGYWVRASRAGEGIATRVVGAVVGTAFSLADVERVEIHHDAANDASGRVARKCGFHDEGTYPRATTAPSETGTGRRWVRTRER